MQFYYFNKDLLLPFLPELASDVAQKRIKNPGIKFFISLKLGMRQKVTQTKKLFYDGNFLCVWKFLCLKASALDR